MEPNPVSQVEVPKTPTRDHVHSIHGLEWQDPYFWLRNKTDPDVISYLESENTYTEGSQA